MASTWTWRRPRNGASTRTRGDSGRALLFLHAGGLAAQVPQEVQLGAAHARRTHQLDLVDHRRMEREDALDALAERHLADREARPDAAAVHADHHALEHLDALLVAFAHLHVHAD